ncbi:Exopolyphosphatase, partial [Dimargaris verticillata]
MANSPTLHRFVSSRRQALQQAVDQVMQGDGNHRLVVTMGNEAADLDSMATAITYSYWRHLAELSQSSTTVFIPLINIPRDEFRLRPECERVIEQTAQIPSNDLVFINDPPIEALFSWVRSRAEDDGSGDVASLGLDIVLVDHAAPNREQKFLEPFVRGVLDHHKEEHKFSNANPRWVAPVGSATTLTTLEGYALLGGQGHSSSAQSTNSSSTSEMPPAASSSPLSSSFGDTGEEHDQGRFPEIVRSQPGLFHLILAPIITDTSNFSPNAGKTKPEDKEAAAL